MLEEEREKGREEGQIEAKRDTALKMLNDGFAPDKIAHYVKMPHEWVQNLKE